jgi:hypothetical protein
MTYDRRTHLLADLEFHVHRDLAIDGVLCALWEKGDLYAITGRGTNWTRGFEHDFASFCAATARSREWCVVGRCDRFLSLQHRTGTASLFVVKAQELLVRENVDVVVVGARDDFADFLPIAELVTATRRSGGFSVLGHPFRIPNSWRDVRSPRERATVRACAERVDIIETYNEVVDPSGSGVNREAANLAFELGKPAIAVSDTHFYRNPRHARSAHSGILISRELIDPSAGGEVITQLERVVIDGRHMLYEAGRSEGARDLLALNPAELLYLYRFALPRLGLVERRRALGAWLRPAHRPITES